MAETGWPLIPREVLPAPIPAAAKAVRRPPVTTSDAGRQLSIFGAETTEPSPSDLAALLAGPGRLERMGGTARVSVRVDAAWRVHVLVAELVSRGLVVNWRRLDQDPKEGVRHSGSPEDREVPPPAAPDPVNPNHDPEAPIDDSMLDEPAPDEPAPDEPSPDEPAPDEPSPDEPAPDEPSPDEPAPDEPSPDQSSPDQSSPDQSSPDQSSPDQSSPDQSSPDQSSPDQSSRAKLGRAKPTRETPRAEEPDITPESDVTPVAEAAEVSETVAQGGEQDAGTAAAGVATFEVRTAYSSRLKALAQAWPAAADQLFLSGPRLRLWVAAAGRPMDGGYALGLDPGYGPGTSEAAGAALRRAGLEAVLSDHGRDYLIMGRRRLARLAELVGERPAAAPEAFWPGGAAA